MKIYNTEVMNIKNAMRGMRYPMASNGDTEGHLIAKIGPKDLKLAKTLSKAGQGHDKYLRQILVSCTIEAPLFWFKEFDQYKVGTVTDSASTMHKLASTPINQSCFEYMICDELLQELEQLRQDYNDSGDKECWLTLINELPCGWLQKRMWTGNYAVLKNIYLHRKGHKLPQWQRFREWIETLPYSELITLKGEED